MNEREARYARFRAEHDQLEAALDDPCACEDDEATLDTFWEATEKGHFILCSDSCPRSGCQTGELNLGWPLNYIYARVRCCHVARRQWHHLGCLFEICPYCGSYLTIACKGDHRANIARERIRPSARTRLATTHCGRLRLRKRPSATDDPPPGRALAEGGTATPVTPSALVLP